MKKISLLVLVLVLALMLPLCASAAGSAITDVWVETQVLSIGQKINCFHVTVADPAILEGITADQFTLVGQARDWSSPDLFPFKADISAVAVEGDQLTISITHMDPKYFYVNNYTVTCANARLTFTNEDISKVVTPVADDFVAYRTAAGDALDYNFYTPADTSTAMPLVLVCHGMGDYLNLLQNRLVLALAETMNQSAHPCYIMAPLFGDPDSAIQMTNDEILAKSVEIIQGLIAEGKVDASRVYVVGKSMGGANTLTAIRTYPDVFAAALALCPAVQTPIDEYDISMIVDKPVYVVDNEGDYEFIYNFVQAFYDKMVAAGSTKIVKTIYTKQSMQVMGWTSYHDIEVQVTCNPFYYDWLFAQSK